MMLILTKIWTFLSSKAAELIAIILAGLAAVAIVRKSGSDSVKLKDQTETLKDIGIKNEVETSVNNASDSDLDKRLSEFRRD